MGASGKRAGPRRKRSLSPAVLLLALGITLCIVAWGYLVKAAIDFGVQARGGTSGSWLYLGIATLGAVACLFIGLMLVVRLLRRLGITSSASTSPSPSRSGEPEPPRPVGGRRASR